VADGQVRCGRCQTQFDALERLIDENESADVLAQRAARDRTAATSSAISRDIEVEEPAEQEDITLEGRHIEISGRYRMPDSPRGEPQIREEVVEEWVEIDDIDETGNEADVIDVDESEAADIEVIDDTAYDTGEVAVEQPDEPVAEQSEPEADLLARPARPAVAPVWKILAGPLVLLLAIQLVHTYRYSLARDPRLGSAVVSLYGALGIDLQPDWDLHGYEILQWHLGSDPATPGTLRVRASLKNVAAFAQPYPLLKLVLEDRWGERVREREFEPKEYLDPATAPDRLLAPSQQATATVSIVDPGPDAEGFRFDVCLHGRRGVVCAADVPVTK
jgi:hypothetical protein